MQKMLFGLAAGVACLAGLAVAGEAQAGTVYKKTTVVKKHYGHDRGSHYYRDHGTRYGNSYYFKGRHHDHWGSRRWSSRYNRYEYYEPTLRTYYYYDGGREGY